MMTLPPGLASRPSATETSVRVRTPAGTEEADTVKVFTLRNDGGLEARITDYGGILLSLLVPDRDGHLADIVLGFDEPEDYEENPAYFGALIGRYANRIAHGRVTIDGHDYRLATNEGPHHLHGGRRGFDSVIWSAEGTDTWGRDEGSEGPDAGPSLDLHYASSDGEEGYPGRLDVRVRYSLTHDDRLVIDYHATADRPTPVNLTHHSYFNLSGDPAADVLDHVLTLHADRFTPTDDSSIPTGEIVDVAGTPFDFREPTPIGARIDDDHPQLALAGGYDHNFVLAPEGDRSADDPRPAARLHHPPTGRVVDVLTSEPGLQLYTGNGLDGTIVGKGGVACGHRSGVALETQHFPDSPHHPAFPSTILGPWGTLRSRTVYAFRTGTDSS